MIVEIDNNGTRGEKKLYLLQRDDLCKMHKCWKKRRKKLKDSFSSQCTFVYLLQVEEKNVLPWLSTAAAAAERQVCHDVVATVICALISRCSSRRGFLIFPWRVGSWKEAFSRYFRVSSHLEVASSAHLLLLVDVKKDLGKKISCPSFLFWKVLFQVKWLRLVWSVNKSFSLERSLQHHQQPAV